MSYCAQIEVKADAAVEATTYLLHVVAVVAHGETLCQGPSDHTKRGTACKWAKMKDRHNQTHPYLPQPMETYILKRILSPEKVFTTSI